MYDKADGGTKEDKFSKSTTAHGHCKLTDRVGFASSIILPNLEYQWFIHE